MRKLNSIVTVVLIGWSVVGCAAHRTIQVGTQLPRGDGSRQGLRAEENVVMHVKEGERDYFVLIGIDKAKNGTYARGVIRNSTSIMEIVEGFMYLTGHYPIGATQNVIAAASGTTIVFELGAGYERVYLLGKDSPREKVKVSLGSGKQPVPGGKKSQMLEPGQYVNVTWSNDRIKLDDPATIPGGPGPITTFLESVKKAVDDTNLPGWPSPWP